MSACGADGRLPDPEDDVTKYTSTIEPMDGRTLIGLLSGCGEHIHQVAIPTRSIEPESLDTLDAATRQVLEMWDSFVEDARPAPE